MLCSNIIWCFTLLVCVVATSLAMPTTKHQDTPPRHQPGSLADVLDAIVKDSHGSLHLTSDGTLRSFAGDNSVIDSRPVDVSTLHGLGPEAPTNGRRTPSTMAVPPQNIELEGVMKSLSPRSIEAAQVEPEILGACSPPHACRNSTSCGDGCGSCTYLGFLPFGLCLAG
ncbi:hypothetical protein EDB81DRAFT_62266 [Dactylonectria macrodidyma]|uniref:Uncharacterized protein n=1 Tax=Dactylonectria macrodidyma TaxID=307937 RepID=A0A9P9ENG7_9HYPO|nr:hypothetical protein EDB81DRAFT_62266 [Dactylonectria macrodidyma]